MIKYKNILVLLLVFFAAIRLSAEITGEEKLRYDVYYKWGLISKKAGSVTIDALSQPDETFQATLIGKSAKWADKIYSVRDTLQGRISQNGYYPLSYQFISHEGGKFKRETISYSRSGDTVNAVCNRYVQKKKSKDIVHSTIELEADSFTVDMLSAFYYMRFMDYQDMKPGEKKQIYIFSGKAKERLTIIYQGQTKFSYRNIKDAPVYKIKFTFTSKNQKKSSGDIYAWISTDSRIPYKLQGDLAIGNIQCLYRP